MRGTIITLSFILVSTIQSKSWVSFSLPFKNPTIRKPGLKNLANTCYMNSVIQSLYNLQTFRYEILSRNFNDESVGDTLRRIFKSIETGTSDVDTRPLANAMGINIRIQEDAHEFLLLLLSSIDESDNHGIKRSIRNRFTGVMESYIQCKNINYSSTRMEPFMDLSLDLDSNQSNTKKDLITMLEAYFKPIELINENKYQTPDNGKQDAIKGYKIVEYPDILIVHINRFAYDITTQMAHKLNHFVQFPENLTLHSFSNSPDSSKLVFSNQLSDNSSVYSCSNFYDLKSIVIHSGKYAHRGHYIAAVKLQDDFNSKDPTWITCNDRIISDPISFHDIGKIAYGDEPGLLTDEYNMNKESLLHSSSAYILFYEKKRK